MVGGYTIYDHSILKARSVIRRNVVELSGSTVKSIGESSMEEEVHAYISLFSTSFMVWYYKSLVTLGSSHL